MQAAKSMLLNFVSNASPPQGSTPSSARLGETAATQPQQQGVKGTCSGAA